jgi:predicted RNase H-like HicB family nuclease
MAVATRRPLEDYLALQYPFNVIADPDGGYVIIFPDLPGCMTRVETVEQIPAMAEEARALWIETEYERGQDIPLPTYPEEYSGKFNLRLPRSLHRSLAEAAEREGISLNQYVVYLLSRRDGQARIESKLDELAGRAVTLPALKRGTEPATRMPRSQARPKAQTRRRS